MFIQPLGPIREHSHEPWAPVSCIDRGKLFFFSFDVLVECLFGFFPPSEHKRTKSRDCLAVIQFLREKKKH